MLHPRLYLMVDKWLIGPCRSINMHVVYGGFSNARRVAAGFCPCMVLEPLRWCLESQQRPCIAISTIVG